MASPRVSVVLPVHNGERFLARAVDSIVDQSFKDLELIVIDDGSTDSTPLIIDRYADEDSRIRVLHEPHAGLITSLNLGCTVARAEFIARMDADDVALPRRLELQLKHLDQRVSLGLIGTGITVVDDREVPLFPVTYPASDAAIRRALPNGSAFAHPSVVFRKSVFLSTGGYRIPYAHAEDYDLWLRMSELCEMANLTELLVRYRFHSGGVSFANLQQQVISMVAAEISAEHRRAGLREPFTEDRAATAEDLPRVAADQRKVHSRILELAAARAAFLVRVSRIDEAVALLDWGMQRGESIDSAAVARAYLVHAVALQKQGRTVSSVAAAWRGVRSDAPRFMYGVAQAGAIALSALVHRR